MSEVVPNPALLPVAPTGPAPTPAPRPSVGTKPASTSFGQVLSGAQAPKFSRHAAERLQRRNIGLDAPTMKRLSTGIAKAAGKGSRDAVVFVDSTAFVVSVRNNTVVTAVGSEHMREHVFTNIDSAVIA